jgi:hypothetical protein
VTSSPDVLQTIADLAAATTTEKKVALHAKVGARLAVIEDAEAQIEVIDAEKDEAAVDLAAAESGLVTTGIRETAQAAQVTTLQASIVALQLAISEGAPPATPEDVAERDEVVALATQVGVTL